MTRLSCFGSNGSYGSSHTQVGSVRGLTFFHLWPARSRTSDLCQIKHEEDFSQWCR